MNEQLPLQYIEFSYGKIGKVKKIKWNPDLGEPRYNRKFIFRDDYGEDWGTVLKAIPVPDRILNPPPEEEEEEDEQINGLAEDGRLPEDEAILEGVVTRYLNEDDLKVLEDLLKDEPIFLEQCRERVVHHSLEMKMLATDIRFDRKKITFHFAAEGRVDFRMLVRDLAAIFRCRIELHQIGARDEASLYVGIGQCGRKLCCRTWLRDFVTIGIKMARAQNLPLNPGKISGNCGRLLCCLSYEYESYLELAQSLPRIGDRQEIDGIPYEVTYISPLAQTVTLQCQKPEERHKRIKVTGEQYYAGSVRLRK